MNDYSKKQLSKVMIKGFKSIGKKTRGIRDVYAFMLFSYRESKE